MEGTNTFHPIRYENIPLDRRKEIAFSKVVCTFRPDKADPNRTRITITGQNIKYPGDVGTKTASLDLVKLLLNSVLSRQGAKFVTFDIKNYYLQTPLDRPKYVRIKLSDIPQDFADEYNLTARAPASNCHLSPPQAGPYPPSSSKSGLSLKSCMATSGPPLHSLS